MVSLTVADTVDQSEWHLPTYDPQNQNKYHYKLHSLDIYFWTQKDALQFVNGVRMVLPPSQVEILDEPGPPPPQQHPVVMSNVVQKLESAAISDPQYNGSKPSSQPSTNANSAVAPPPAGTPPQPTNFAPMAYNPAAPAAPETIRHREKTPPPDEDPLNPLAVAVAYDYQKQPFTPGYPPQAQFPPGVTSPGLPPSLGSPGAPPQGFGGPPHPGVQRAATMPIHGGVASPGLTSPFGQGFPGQGGPAPPPPGPPPPQVQPTPPHQPQPQQAQAPPNQPTPPSVTSPGLPPPPPGGYSQYSYGQAQQPPQGGQGYNIHQQVYRPTEQEAANNFQTPSYGNKEPRGRMEENAGRLERGVTGMFKKFEKKFG